MRVLALAAICLCVVCVHGGCPVSAKANTCVTGMSYAWFHNITTADECCAKCVASTACKAFDVRILPGAAAQCALKNETKHQVPSSAARNCTFSVVLGPDPSQPTPLPHQPTPAPPHPTPVPPTALSFSDMFKGGAVLQRGKYVAVWGVSAQKTVSLALSATEAGGAVSITGKVNASGIWMVHLPPQQEAYNRTLTVTDSSGSQTEVVSFGETVLCVGQVASPATPA
jgi:hypothetical protein